MIYKNKKISEHAADLLLRIHAVSFRFNPPYTFTSGIKSPIYLDNRIVMSYPKERNKIIAFYISVIDEHVGRKNIDCISATASAAIPQGAWIAQKLNLPLVYVRPTSKAYGKGNKLEGHFKKGSRVLIIEDHISTAASVINNAATIRSLGGKVEYCIATTNYETTLSQKQIRENKIKVYSLTTGKIIVENALKKAMISKKEKEIVDLWFSAPSDWGKKMGLDRTYH